MAFQDKPIQCFDRGVTFTFILEEQAFFNLRDLPTRKERQASSGQRNNIPSYQYQCQTFTATCSRCGKSTQQ
jgi:hypothetical protein